MMKRTFLCVAVLFFTATLFAEKQTITLVVEQMECGNCKAKVEKLLAYEKGVKDLEFNLEHRLVTVTFDDAKTDVKALQIALLKELKYKSRLLKEGEELPIFEKEHHHDGEH